MGFNRVYKSLQEIFPQIDARALRAVAIEHSKDADAAVEAVLVEIIPFFTEKLNARSPLTESTSVRKSPPAAIGAVATIKDADGPYLNTVGSVDVINGYKVDGENQNSFPDADDGQKEAFSDSNDCHHEREGNTAELALLKNTDTDDCSNGEVVELIDKNGINTLQIEVAGDPKTEDPVRAVKCSKDNIRMFSDGTPHQTLETRQEMDMGVNWNKDHIQGIEAYNQLETKLTTATNKENDQVKSSVDVNNTMIEPASLMVRDPSPSPSGNSVPLVGNIPSRSNEEKLDASLSTNTASNVDTNSKTVGTEDDSISTATMTQSSQNQSVDVLDEILADARSYKKILFSAMQSLITLMREVELKEQAAELAKDEAAISGTDILVKVEELGQKMQHVKDANDTLAAEVYGEKAILATEMRELQSRLLALSDERDKSLTVLDEMRQALEVRLAAIENEMSLAEQEKLEKEHAAANALAEQELIMEKVVQESKILKQQAKDNAKLLEFLVDRGRVVDTLQGEIAVICQDVRILKEKFDEHVPFSKSLSSSHTSFILASSSSSSSKSLITDQVELAPVGVVDPFQNENKGDFVSYSDEQSCEEKAAGEDHEALIEDGWELF